MDEFHDSVMAALLPTTYDWCRQDLPHLTIVYAGKVPDLKESVHNEMLKEALSASMLYPPLSIPVTNVAIFGDDDEQVDVLLMEETPELQQLYRFFKEWDASEHSFTPHCTIGPTGSVVGITIPHFIQFDRILVDWGVSQSVYKLVGEGADDVRSNPDQQGTDEVAAR